MTTKPQDEAEALGDLLDEFACAVAANAGHMVVGEKAPADAAGARAKVAALVTLLRERAEDAENLLRFGKAVSPSMLDSVSDGDARILSAWAAVRQREADQAKKARNEAESRASAAEAECERLRTTLREIVASQSDAIGMRALARAALSVGETETAAPRETT